jgi:hypothetical protein
MKVLVACEYSGTVRDAFLAKGHDAMSCDLLPTDSPGPHHQGDVLEILDQGWDLMIAHPPCTYLAVSGLHWNKRVEGRAEKTEEALLFVQALMDAPIHRIAIENPVSCISSRIRKPDQIVQPWWFGDDASKKTCFWLKNLPELKGTSVVNPRYSCSCGQVFDYSLGKHGCPNCLGEGKVREIWANQTPSGQNKLGPSADRWKLRSVTYQGIANAMAEQWGNS